MRSRADSYVSHDTNASRKAKLHVGSDIFHTFWPRGLIALSCWEHSISKHWNQDSVWLCPPPWGVRAKEVAAVASLRSIIRELKSSFSSEGRTLKYAVFLSCFVLCLL